MCGASKEQKNTYAEQQSFYKEIMDEQHSAYSADQGLLKTLNSVFTPIFVKGPKQEGYTPEQKAELNASVTDQTAQNYKQAAQVVGENMAASGGGNTIFPSAVEQSVKASIATSAAQNESQQRQQIQQASWDQGYQNWLNAGQGMFNVSSQLNPLGYSQQTTNAGSAAASTANQIAQESNSWINAAIGAAGMAAGGWAGGGFKLPSHG